jgi:hypothetical protein
MDTSEENLSPVQDVLRGITHRSEWLCIFVKRMIEEFEIFS